jgi:hypothetical protein
MRDAAVAKPTETWLSARLDFVTPLQAGVQLCAHQENVNEAI